MATAKTPDLPTPYIGQVVHYVRITDEHIPATVVAVLEVDGSRDLDPVTLLDTTGDNLSQDLGTQRSDQYHRGTWHDITAECAQKLTVVETNPTKRSC